MRRPQRASELPWLIINRIIHYAIQPVDKRQLQQQSSNSSSSTTISRKTPPTSFIDQYLPLLSLCRRWRAVALSHLCKHSILQLDDSACLFNTLVSVSLNMPHISRFAFRHNSTLTISVSQADITSGLAINALGGPEFKNAVFHAATRLVVKLALLTDQTTPPIEGTPLDNVRQFVTRIRKMMPYVTSIDIQCVGNFFYDEAVVCQQLERWLAMYFSPETALRVFRSKFVLPRPAAPQVSVAVTSIEHIWKNDNETTLALLHRLAPALQTLAITYKTVSRTELLFTDSNSELVAFPRLQTLSFNTWQQQKIRHRPTIDPTIVPFPALTRLHISMEYPFGDDLLFRGNNETLEQLRIELDMQTIAMLKKYKVFADSRFKRLRSISAECNTHRVGGNPLASYVFTNFVAGMTSASAGQSLSFDDGSAMKYSVRNLTRCSSDLARVRVLNLKNANLTFSQITVLLRKMTMLTELKCEFAGLGPDYDRMPVADRPERARSSCVTSGNGGGGGGAVGGRHFKHLTLLGYLANMQNVAECAILLALACPKLTNFSIMDTLKPEFNKELRLAIKAEPYNAVAKEVEHLLFKDIDHGRVIKK
ncbi:hypothetical protein IWW38_002894 [Coemansia aciculifera]|uniref:Uncharacterized protein n=1 Tax=Coemansia aciculifera TaxID=417176 RepID=A0ACC1M377_9FUNG|nr:hypothetical protein IWW38_002894 [Coemansia aciculifera]